jgi:LTXXQ motif family protein
MQVTSSLSIAGCGMARRNALSQLAQIKANLVMTGPQQLAWDAFVDVLGGITHAMDAIEVRIAYQSSEQAPSLSTAFELQEDFLAARLKATRQLRAATDNLYRYLTPGQRASADRLLPAVCGARVPSPRQVH